MVSPPWSTKRPKAIRASAATCPEGRNRPPAMAMARGPDSRTTPIPPRPGGVEMATIVSEAGDGPASTTLSAGLRGRGSGMEDDPGAFRAVRRDSAAVRFPVLSGVSGRHDGDLLEEPVADAARLDSADLGQGDVHQPPLVGIERAQEALLAAGLDLLRRAHGDLHDLVLAQ